MITIVLTVMSQFLQLVCSSSNLVYIGAGLDFLHEGGVSCDSPFCVFFGVAGAGSGSSTCMSSSDCGLVAPTLLGSVPISVTRT